MRVFDGNGFTMTPDDAEAVATLLYVEMLEQGFTRVGEFHYLHHDRDGTPYANPGEMAARIARAAGATGIGLTLLSSFYAHGTFGGAAPHGLNSPKSGGCVREPKCRLRATSGSRCSYLRRSPATPEKTGVDR